MISGIPDPAAAGEKFVTMYTEEKTRAKLKTVYTKNPTKYECFIIANVAVYFHPEKFSTARFMNIAANPVPTDQKMISDTKITYQKQLGTMQVKLSFKINVTYVLGVSISQSNKS